MQIRTGHILYKELAEGDVGTIITGFTSVSDTDGYLGDGMARLSDDGQISGWKKLTDICHQYNEHPLDTILLKING